MGQLVVMSSSYMIDVGIGDGIGCVFVGTWVLKCGHEVWRPTEKGRPFPKVTTRKLVCVVCTARAKVERELG